MSSYQKNFLSNVIFRIDFPVLLDLEKNKPAEFQSKIIEDFPILEPLQQIEIKPGEKIDDSLAMPAVWSFSNKEKNQKIELTSYYMSFSIFNFSYTTFNDFKEKIEKLLESFFECYSISIINRIGLRYINEIKIEEANPLNWNEYINSNLVDGLNFFEDKTKLRRIYNITTASVGGDDFLNLKYGIFNSKYPAEIVDKEFVLDYDCYSRAIEKEGVVAKLTAFNTIITEYFEKSIMEEFRTKILNQS